MPANLRGAQGLACCGAGASGGQGPGHRSQAGPLGGHGGQDRAERFGTASSRSLGSPFGQALPGCGAVGPLGGLGGVDATHADR